MKQIIESLKAGVGGAVMGLVLSFLANFYLLPIPETEMANALGNGASGFISGFMGGFMGLLLYFRKAKSLKSYQKRQ